jgi:hypothetical protein
MSPPVVSSTLRLETVSSAFVSFSNIVGSLATASGGMEGRPVEPDAQWFDRAGVE